MGGKSEAELPTCTTANPIIALRLPFTRPADQFAKLWSLGPLGAGSATVAMLPFDHLSLANSARQILLDDSESADILLADPEQSASIDYLLRSRNLAMSVQGPAGSGKMTFATEAVKAIETFSGRRVIFGGRRASETWVCGRDVSIFAADTQ